VEVMPSVEVYDNSERLLYDMNCHDVDMCLLMSSYGMNNELNQALVDKHQGRFAALCAAKETYDRARRGEIEWTMEEVCRELRGEARRVGADLARQAP
jgi:hypothetical protein